MFIYLVYFLETETLKEPSSVYLDCEMWSLCNVYIGWAICVEWIMCLASDFVVFLTY